MRHYPPHAADAHASGPPGCTPTMVSTVNGSERKHIRYPYASTSPIYLELPAQPPPAAEDAGYFVVSLDRVLGEARARDDYNNEREKQTTLDFLQTAQTRPRQLARPDEAIRP